MHSLTMSFLDNFTEEQQALLIELMHQKFQDKSLQQQPARPELQEEEIPCEDDDGQVSRTCRSNEESDNDGEGSQYCFSDEESENDNEDKRTQVCSL